MSATTSASRPSAAGHAERPRSLPWWRRAAAREVALASAAGLLALAAAGVVLRLWHARLGLPIGYGGDGLWLQQTVKAIVDHGWFLSNPDLGAPFGQQIHDFTGSLGDNLHFLVIKAMSVVSQDPVKLVNAYFLMGFFLCAATACLVLRRLGASAGAAVVAAVLFSLLPAHVGGGEGRLMLGAYWAIPFSALLIMRVFAGEPLFARRSAGGRLTRWASKRTLATVAMCFLIAGTGLYYALFTVILLAIAAAAVVLVRRDVSAALGGAVAMTLVLAIFVVHISPSIVYRLRHGTNTEIAGRPVSDSNLYATNLAQLVLPVENHRVGVAEDVARKFREEKPFPGAGETSLSALGFFAALGFVGLILVAVVPGARTARERAGPAAATAMAGFLLGTTGGIGLLIALLVTPDLRAWGRISPLLGFVGLFAVAIAYDALRSRSAGAPRRRRLAVTALLPVALLAGVADQTTSRMVPSYERDRNEYRSDAIFVDKIEARLPDRAGVLQLPAAEFPERGTIAGMVDYSHMRGPLHANSLRFSYGAVKGRPAGEWATRLSRRPLADALPLYVNAGFRGIWLDRRGFDDAGAELDTQLRALPQAAPIVSDDGQLVFYSLLEYARRWMTGRTPAQLQAARDSALYPTRVEPGAGTRLLRVTRLPQIADPARGGALLFANPGRLDRRIELTGRLLAGRAGSVAIALPSGRSVMVRAGPGGRPFTVRVPLAAGAKGVVRLRSDRVPGPLQLLDLRATDDSLMPR